MKILLRNIHENSAAWTADELRQVIAALCCMLARDYETWLQVNAHFSALITPHGLADVQPQFQAEVAAGLNLLREQCTKPGTPGVPS